MVKRSRTDFEHILDTRFPHFKEVYPFITKNDNGQVAVKPLFIARNNIFQIENYLINLGLHDEELGGMLDLLKTRAEEILKKHPLIPLRDVHKYNYRGAYNDMYSTRLTYQISILEHLEAMIEPVFDLLGLEPLDLVGHGSPEKAPITKLYTEITVYLLNLFCTTKKKTYQDISTPRIYKKKPKIEIIDLTI